MTEKTETTEATALKPISIHPGGPPPPPDAAPARPADGAFSPFGTVPAPLDAPAPAAAEPTETIAYRLLPSGPPLDPREVETDDPLLEVVILWGDQSVLHAAHLSPPRPFCLGDESDEKGKQSTDYLIDSETLGTARLPLIVEAGAGHAVVFPRGATGSIESGGQSTPLEELLARGELQPCIELEGAWQYPLRPGTSAHVSYGGFTFLVRTGSAGKRIGIGGRPHIDWGYYRWTLGAALLAFLMLLLFHLMPPKGAALNLDAMNRHTRLFRFVNAPDEYIDIEVPNPFLDEPKKEREGKRHAGEEGKMGDPKAAKTKKRYGVKGPEDHPDPHMAREAAKEEASSTGIIGALMAQRGAWNSPTSPFGRDTAIGRDPMDALGALMGDGIGQNFGLGGLGMRGTGRGGGGTGHGTIGLGTIDTMGAGGYGEVPGIATGKRLTRTGSRVPRIRPATADVKGSLSKEVIRRTIRRHINEVRFCYEQELTRRPDARGRVAVRFMISPTGAVQSAVATSDSLKSAALRGCIAGAVKRWIFPAPENSGFVIVTYPFVLEPAGG